MLKNISTPVKLRQLFNGRFKARQLWWKKFLLGAIVLSVILGALLSTKILATAQKKIADAKEAARPANIHLTKITDADCKDCFNLDKAVTELKGQNIKVLDEKSYDFNSVEGQNLIKNLNIQRVPTYVFTGEVTKGAIDSFVKENGYISSNTFIFTKITPIFVDTASGKELGKVTVTTITDSACPQCFSFKPMLGSLKQQGLKVVSEKEIEWNSSEGQTLIDTYKLTKIPALILSPEADYYDNLKKSWPSFGTVESDKTFISRNLQMPYRDLEQGKILGLVDIIYLTDKSCSDCYKAEEYHKAVLTKSYRIATRSEELVDISSPQGQNLVEKYKIISVPTVLVSPDLDQYSFMKNVWKSVGTIETDGWYVFRDLNKLGRIIYKDLRSGQVIRPQVQASPAP